MSTTAARHRLTLSKAEERARQILALHRNGRKQREIAAALGISRALVAQYLSPSNKARCRTLATANTQDQTRRDK